MSFLKDNYSVSPSLCHRKRAVEERHNRGGFRGNFFTVLLRSVVKKSEKTSYFRMAKAIRNLNLLEQKALKRPLTLDLTVSPC